jgi:3-oxoacyl-[acyl-carrier protein] reductase
MSYTLIVGGTSTFGKALVKPLLNAGHHLVLTYFPTEDITQLRVHAGADVELVPLDVTQTESVAKMLQMIKQPISHVVYSVGAPLSFTAFEREEWSSYEHHWKTQTQGLYNVIQGLVHHKQPLSRIVAVGSSVTLGAPPARLSGYTVSKYALFGLVRSLAVELASQGVTVNMVSPGMSGEGLSKEFPELMLELAKKQTPLRRLVSEKDVAGVVQFLLSDSASFITGLNVPLDGGIHVA